MTTTCEGPCGQRFVREDALLLTCFHPVCAECARPEDVPANHDIVCQRCESTTPLNDLIPDHVTRHIVKVENLSKVHKECDQGCPEKATFRCHECTLDLCSRCAHSHPRSQRFKDHKVVEVHQVGPADVDMPVACKVHPQEVMKAFCTTCKILICPVCASTTHRQHDVQPLDAAQGRVRAELASLLILQGTEDSSEPLLSAAIGRVQETRAALQTHLSTELARIDAHERVIIACVEEDAKVLREEAGRAVERTDAALKAQEAALRQHGALLRQMNEYTHALLTMVKGSELVEVGLAIKERLEAARGVGEEDVRPVVGPEGLPHFEPQPVGSEAVSSVGRIVERQIVPWTMPRKGPAKVIYVIGGHDGRKPSRRMLRFDLQKQTWDVHPTQLRVPRECHGMAVWGTASMLSAGMQRGHRLQMWSCWT